MPAGTTTSTPLPTGSFTVEPTRSGVEFRAKHIGMAPVRGGFGTFEGTLELSDDLTAARAWGSVSVASLDTRNRRRDAHLRSPAFFDVERCPTLSFESRRFRRLDDGALEIEGELTLRGTTRPIALTAALRRAEPDAAGDERVALEVTGRLSRSDYGMTSFKVLVSDTVDLRLDISAVKEA
jgi:polyisoprenoid-binding protein YceI